MVEAEPESDVDPNLAEVVEEEPTAEAHGAMGEAESPEAQGDDELVYPFGYACPEYERCWDSPLGDIAVMAEEEPVVGIGDEGGIVLSDALDARLNPEGRPVFGSQRMQVVQLGSGTVLSLRIGVVSVNGHPRTRVIVTKIAGEHDVGLMTVLDFKVIKPQIEGLAWDALEEEIEGFNREDLYDYEFAVDVVEGPNAMMFLQVAVLSGKRDLSSGSNAQKLAQSATDLVLTWVYADVSQLSWQASSSRPPISVVRNFNWPGSMIFGDDGKYHSISNLQLSYDRVYGGSELVSTNLGTALITFLDRSANSAADVLSHRDGVATVRLGMLFVARYSAGHYQTERYYALAYPPQSIEQLMGTITDGSTHELRFWSRSGDHYTFMVRGATESRYYVLQIEPGSAALAAEGESISAKIKNIRLVGQYDGTMRLHHWRNESGDERFLGTRVLDGLTTQAEGEEDDGGIDRELCLVSISDPSGTSPGMDFQGIGPKDFSLSSFGACGNFIYWPGTKDGVAEMTPTQAESEVDVELVDAGPVERSWLMGSRFRNGQFSEPFYMADLKHEVDHVVSIRDSGNALDVVSCGLTDREQGKADVFYTRIPYVRSITATHALVESQYVVAGRNANFFITLRNDGNTYIGGCTVEMWHEGTVVASSEVTFSKETLQESSYNPAIPNSDKLKDVEPDYALAPGKTSVYLVTMRIPDSWTGGVDENGNRIVKKVKFRACSPTTAPSTADSVATQAEGVEEEGIEYSVPEPQAPMEVLTLEVYDYDNMSHTDAPMTLLGSDATSSSSQGVSQSVSQSSDPLGGLPGADAQAAVSQGTVVQGTSRTTLPYTGDQRGVEIGGALAAAAGAAMLAYERRRAANEARTGRE